MGKRMDLPGKGKGNIFESRLGTGGDGRDQVELMDREGVEGETVGFG